MNYLEEQTDGEAMINSIQNGDQPLPVIAQVSLVGTAQNAPSTLKDPKFWTAEEKKTRKIDRLARSLLIQGLPNDIYSLIDSNETAKDLWDALERQMRGSEYGEQDRKAAIFKIKVMNDALGYKKKAVVLNSDPLALVAEKTKVSKQKDKVVVSSDSEGSGSDDFSKLNKITALLAKAFNRRKFYSKPTNNDLRTSSTSQSANKKQEFVKTDDKKVEKKADEKKKDMSKVKCYNCKKEGHFAKDFKKEKVKDYNYYKTKMLLAKKDSDEQALLAEDQAWMESSSDFDQEINANMVFMAQIEKVLSKSDQSSSSAKETIAEVAYYTSESESESKFETSEYYDNSTNYGLFVNNDDDQETFHVAIESASENFFENHIDSQKDYNKSEVDHNDFEEKEHLVDKLIRKFNHKISKCQKRVEKANQQSKYFKNQNKDLQEKYDVLKNQVNTFEEKTIQFNEQIKVLNEKNVDLLAQTKVLKDQLQVKHVVIDTHVECHENIKQIVDQEVLFDKMSVQLVELDKHVRDLKNTSLERLNVCENKIHKMGQTNQTVCMIMPSNDILYNGRKGIGFENPRYFEKAKDLRPSLYDEKQTSSLKPYVPNVILEKIIIDLEDEVVSLLEKEKANLKTIESLKSKGFESSENEISESKNQNENDCQVVEKECDKIENSKVIAPGMFKLSVSQSVSPMSMLKTSCESNNVEIKLKRKRRKRKSSKQNVNQVNNDVLRANSDFVYFSDLDTFSSVRRPKHSGVIWKKKLSSNTSNVDLFSDSCLKLNKNVKRYSRKDLLACNNSHLRETSSVYVCNDIMNVSCNPRMCDLLDDNNFFIFDDESVRISPVSKMPFRKKPSDSMNVRSKSNMIKSLSRTVRCLKHMTGNHALLTNFLEKFLGTVRFGNNNFAVIAGYGDAVIGSMTIKKVYYVEGLGHNLFSVGQFYDKGLEVAFQKSTCFVRNEDGVDLLTGDRSSNFYTIALNEVASNSSTCLLAKASSF
nr:integrase, catalytic region, zinc finger, CCHC-type, peptidase aspartic, catalytic [Tanacetum cinerariifolium]